MNIYQIILINYRLNKFQVKQLSKVLSMQKLHLKDFLKDNLNIQILRKNINQM